jgi:TP901 family phage tail tape measure protein
MALATRNLYLVLKARDEASRVLRGFGRELTRAGKLAQAGNLRQRAAQATLLASQMQLSGATAAQVQGQEQYARQLRATAADLERSHRQTVRLANALHTVGSTLMTVGAGIAAIGAGSLAFLYSSVKVAQEYERQVRLTSTQVDNFSASLEELSAVGLKAAQDIAVPFEEIQPALYNILSSTNANLLQAEILLRGFAKTAVAGQVSIEAAAKGTIPILNAFNIPLERVNDILDIQFQLVRKGVGTYDEFSKVFGRVVPSATRAGQSFETVAAMLAYLTRNGLSAANASSSAARALDALSHPTAVKHMEQLGIAVRNARGEFLPLEVVLKNVRDHLDKLPNADRVAALVEIFKGAGGTIQARRFLEQVLLRPGELEEFVGFLGDMSNASGQFENAYDTMAQSVAAQTELLRNKWKVLQESVGRFAIPIFLKFVTVIQSLLDWFNRLDPGTKKWITQILAVVGVLGVVGGLILVVIGGLASMFAAIMTAGAAFFYLIGGVVLLIAILAGLTTAFLTIYHKSENFRNGLKQLHEQLVRLYNEAVLPTAQGIKAAWDKYVAPALSRAWDLLDKKVLPAYNDFSKVLFDKIIPAVKEVANWLKSGLAEAFKFVGWVIDNVLIPAFAWVLEYYNNHKESVDKVISALIFFGKWAAKIGLVIAAVFGVAVIGPIIAIILAFVAAIIGVGIAISAIVSGITWLVKWIGTNVPKAWDYLVEKTKSAWHAIQDFFVGVWQGIADFFVGIWNKIVGFFTGVMDTIAKTWDYFWKTKIGGLVKAVLDSVVAVINLALTVISLAFAWFWHMITTGWNFLWDYVSNKVSSAWTVITAFLSAAWATIVEVAKAVWGAVVDFFTFIWDKIVEQVMGKWNMIMAFLGGVWFGIQAVAKAIWDKIGFTVIDTLDRVWVKIQNTWQTIKDFFSGAWNWLFEAGKNIIQGLIDGITSKIKDVTDTVNTITKKLKDFFPHSPAKRGPLSGRGGMFYAGQTMVKQLQAGLASMSPVLEAGASGVATAGANALAAAAPTNGRGDVNQTFHITTQEISPRRHSAELGFALAGRM